MPEHAVVIAGGGPTGLMLAGELALAGADVVVVERRTARDLTGSRAGGLTPRTIEVLDQRGIADRFLSEGTVGQYGHYSGIFFDVSELATRHNYELGLLQYRVEKILAEWTAELGVPIHYGRVATGFTQDPTGVDVTLSDGTTLRATYLAGCDGGRSLIRKTAGIAFPGWDPSTSCLVADVKMTEEPPLGLHREGGFHSFFEFEGEDTVRVMVTEPHVGNTGEPTLADISNALTAARGTDYGLRSATWISRFTDATRQAATYRDRRVLLAGDAAHIHFPIGGQGLNTGIQDAVNLGWKLAQVVNGTSGEELLDTYHAERHPVATRVLHNTMAQTALNGPGERVDALRDTVAELLSMKEPRTRIAEMMCGLDIHYDFGEGHPLLGRRMPDLDLGTSDGSTRLFTLLHQARGILLNFGYPWDFDITRWAHRVSALDARYTGGWQLPAFGEVAAPDAVLVRPDGYVAWVGDGTTKGLPEALDKWFA
ncbi:Anhydrotetracycline monooxygenase [Mycobacterium simulans]|uniref:Anhydrotetracycline monooxygenase n=1 Tax=Mycobacterium simulans TaxID=627089 RepID=A0A7Z7IFM1_9MYCO|nr:FAD-dependent monooxygenase [Mycobacterium simulans]SOJ52587.1 Anhydrotetracycline monooxygenase [Mycobacterium simulans]